MWAFTYTPGHIYWIIDGRFLCFLVGRFTEHFRRTDLFQRAVGPGVSVPQGLVAWMGLGRAFLGKGDTGNSGPRRLFAPSGLPFSFLLLLSSPCSHIFHFSHLPLETLHVLRFTPLFEADLLIHLGGEIRASQSGATRCPHSNTTNDAAIGQKRNIPTLLRRWLCPVTRLAYGLGSLHVEHGGGARCPEKARPSRRIRESRASPPKSSNQFQALCRFIFKLFLNNDNNETYPHRGRQNRSHGIREAKKKRFLFSSQP